MSKKNIFWRWSSRYFKYFSKIILTNSDSSIYSRTYLYGGMAEWLIAAVLKTAVPQGTQSSNLCPSAIWYTKSSLKWELSYFSSFASSLLRRTDWFHLLFFYTISVPCSSRRSREIYSLTFSFMKRFTLELPYWKHRSFGIVFYTTIKRVCALSETKKSPWGKAETLDSTKKNPHSRGDFSKEMYPIFTLEDGCILSLLS